MDEEKGMLELFRKKSEELWNEYQSRDKNQALEDFIVNHRVSDDEKEADVAKELDDYVVTYYAKRKELNKSGMEPSEWLEHEVGSAVRDLYPEATEEDVNEAKEELAGQMLKNNEIIADALDREMKSVADGVRHEDGME